MSKPNLLSRIARIIVENGQSARDARIGAVGVQPIRDLYTEASKERTLGNEQKAQQLEEQASNLSKRYTAANVSGIMSAPLAGEFATYGLLGGAARVAGGMAGSTVGGTAGALLGNEVDKAVGNGKHTWSTVGGVAGGLVGWNPGSRLLYKGALNQAGRGLQLTTKFNTNRFNSDVLGNVLNKESLKFNIGKLDYVSTSNYTPFITRRQYNKTVSPELQTMLVENGQLKRTNLGGAENPYVYLDKGLGKVFKVSDIVPNENVGLKQVNHILDKQFIGPLGIPSFYEGLLKTPEGMRIVTSQDIVKPWDSYGDFAIPFIKHKLKKSGYKSIGFGQYVTPNGRTIRDIKAANVGKQNGNFVIFDPEIISDPMYRKQGGIIPYLHDNNMLTFKDNKLYLRKKPQYYKTLPLLI